MLLDEKSPEIFLKHKRYFYISESFASNWFFFFFFVALIDKKTVDLEKLIEYWVSGVS